MTLTRHHIFKLLIMKKIFRKLAGKIVTIYANRLYTKAVKEADKAHEKLKERIYVVSSWGDISELVVLNRDTFRKMKKTFNSNDNMASLMEGAWYYTTDRAGKNGLSDLEKDIRRVSFIRHVLSKASLL